MPGLTEKDLNHFSQRLQDRREELRTVIHDALLSSQHEDYADLAGMVHDSGDESFAELLRGVNFASRGRELEESQDVDAALDRIKNGTYGTCVDCGNAIAPERLNAYLAAKRCITCQSRRENLRGGRDATPSL
ncbi:MAG: TraR/DksA C4-type zinc finger protein [Pseudomonadota bacterium]